MVDMHVTAAEHSQARDVYKRQVVSGKAMINPEITDKVVKLFNHMAQSSLSLIHI